MLFGLFFLFFIFNVFNFVSYIYDETSRTMIKTWTSHDLVIRGCQKPTFVDFSTKYTFFSIVFTIKCGIINIKFET